MEKISLKAVKRPLGLKANAIRSGGAVPVEYYGHGVPNISLDILYGDLRRAYKAAGSNTVIDLEVEGEAPKKVLFTRVDFDPVRDTVSYVELINVRMDEEVTAKIPVRLEGVAPAVKDLGGILVQSLDELEISCLPGDLPHEFIVNVESIVDFATTLHVSDVVVPAGVKILTELDAAVATVTAPQEEEVAPEVAPTADQVEITTEKKEGEGALEGDKKAEGGKKD
ncbi:MAG: 50S ribosomal protein L25 [Candidatus Gracilibacteria bacterium]|jgi:large subunit ribosomal protein L25